MSNATNKPRLDKRRMNFARDVVKVTRDKPLSDKQRRMLMGAISKAHKRASAHYDERSGDTFRHEECERAAKISGVSAARDAHFPALMAHFCHLAGDGGNAYFWAMRDNPLVQRQLRMLYKVRELIAKRKRLSIDCERVTQIGDAACERMHRCAMESATADQLDLLYTTLKDSLPFAPLTTAVNAETSEGDESVMIEASNDNDDNDDQPF